MGPLRPALVVLLGAVGLMLVVAAANVANLMLARAAGRSGELAIRAALGAGRWPLVRHLLAESALLALAGGLGGLLLAWWTLPALLALAPQDLPRLAEVGINHRALLITLVVAAGTGPAVGLVPALRVSRHDVASLLGAGRRHTGDRATHLLRRTLIAAQVAVAFVILVGAALLSSSLARLGRVDPGLSADRVMAVGLPLPEMR